MKDFLSTDFLSVLNNEQRDAAKHMFGPTLVLAGAGTGKTSVLTHRIAYLIQQGISPHNILALTFTRKAAGEMQERIKQLAGGNAKGIRVGTFHSLALEIVRKYCHCVGLPRDFSLDDDTTGKITFDSLLTYAAEILRSNETARIEFQNRFRFILVDEFQDTNEVQFQILCSLLTPEKNLFVVGDDDQSIYSFQGSSRKLIMTFTEHFPDAGFVKLTKNYRCSKEIIALANYLVKGVANRIEKSLVAMGQQAGVVNLIRLGTDTRERDFIAQAIAHFKVEEQRQYSEFAVLVRSNSHAQNIRQTLSSQNVPCGRANNGVNIQTLHSAKGLEFPVVFIPSLQQGVLPHIAAVGVDAFEEERRLFYVGVTRAKERLVLSYANERAGHSQKPSPFLHGVRLNRLVNYQCA